MKAGPHSGNSLEQIMRLKFKEQNKLGKFYWGYSGTLCNPLKVQRFAKESVERGTWPVLVLSPTSSAYDVGRIQRVSEYSHDNETWTRLELGAYLWNCRFAAVASNLRRVQHFINLNEYVEATGTKERSLGEYVRHRVSKACAFFVGESTQSRVAKVCYVAELKFPFCVFLR